MRIASWRVSWCGDLALLCGTPLGAGQFTRAVFAYLETRVHDSVVATNIRGDEGKFADGQLVAWTQCAIMAISDSETVWFGTDADGLGLWNGRIDELAWFDKARRNAGKITSPHAPSPLWGEGRVTGRNTEVIFPAFPSDKDIAGLYQAALQEMARSE